MSNINLESYLELTKVAKSCCSCKTCKKGCKCEKCGKDCDGCMDSYASTFTNVFAKLAAASEMLDSFGMNKAAITTLRALDCMMHEVAKKKLAHEEDGDPTDEELAGMSDAGLTYGPGDRYESKDLWREPIGMKHNEELIDVGGHRKNYFDMDHDEKLDHEMNAGLHDRLDIDPDKINPEDLTSGDQYLNDPNWFDDENDMDDAALGDLGLESEEPMGPTSSGSIAREILKSNPDLKPKVKDQLLKDRSILHTRHAPAFTQDIDIPDVEFHDTDHDEALHDALSETDYPDDLPLPSHDNFDMRGLDALENLDTDEELMRNSTPTAPVKKAFDQLNQWMKKAESDKEEEEDAEDEDFEDENE